MLDDAPSNGLRVSSFTRGAHGPLKQPTPFFCPTVKPSPVPLLDENIAFGTVLPSVAHPSSLVPGSASQSCALRGQNPMATRDQRRPKWSRRPFESRDHPTRRGIFARPTELPQPVEEREALMRKRLAATHLGEHAVVDVAGFDEAIAEGDCVTARSTAR